MFKNELLGVADPLYTLAFQGLWVLADREGRLEDRPLRIKAETFPYRDVDMDPLLDWLQAEEFIQRYAVADKRYIQVLNFRKHQNPHKNETESEIPAPEQIGSTTEIIGTRSEKIGSARADSLNLIPDSLNLSTATSASADLLLCPVNKIIDAYHGLMPDNPVCKILNTARRGAIKARWNEAAKLTCKPFGYQTVDDGLKSWKAFFATCAESSFLTGRANPQPGKPPFLADIDFLMSPAGFAKCLENKYHREAA
ncbi:MAG: phage replication protein [Rugosibacter sp.]|nr:MAG: phage replication protein [Rugosibacter sp.]